MSKIMLERSGTVKRNLRLETRFRPIKPLRVPFPGKRRYTPKIPKPGMPENDVADVTIAAGFRCSDGLVLCADTRISGWVYKSHRTKFVLRETASCKVILVYAGTVAIMKMAAEKIEARVNAARPIITSIRAALDAAVLEFHTQYANQYPQDIVPLMLCGIVVPSDPQVYFFRIEGAAVFTSEDFEAIGIGDSLANFLVPQYVARRSTMEDSVVKALRVMAHVKKNVPGCGGNSHIFKISPSGFLKLIEGRYASEVEKYILTFDNQLQKLGDVLLAETRTFESELNRVKSYCKDLRQRFDEKHSWQPSDDPEDTLQPPPTELDILWG